jgi:K+:H+ antiporter
LDTTIGIVVLSAGVGNDIIGWTLLALSVALVNAGSGIEALYILLTAIAWTLFILIPVKKIMLYLARRTGSIENELSPLMMTISIMLMFASAFFTDVIGGSLVAFHPAPCGIIVLLCHVVGIHAIFGAFLAGLAIPHEGGLAIALTEKLEDLTSIIFLPLVIFKTQGNRASS